MKPLTDLGNNDCRWPLEAGGFCGEPKTRGSYCAEHGARAYLTQTGQPTTDRPAPKLVAHKRKDRP